MPQAPYPEGTILHDRTGQGRPDIIRRGNTWVQMPPAGNAVPATPDAPMEPLPGSSQPRVIASMQFGPALRGNQIMENVERQSPRTDFTNGPFGGRHRGSGNPLSDSWGTELLSRVPGVGPIAANIADSVVGNNQHQQYRTGMASFLGAVAPIMAGQSQTPSEMTRQIEQYLPRIGDTPEVLQQKAQVRRMMLNAVADMTSRPRPYPNLGTFDMNDLRAARGGAPAPAAPPRRASSRPAAGPSTGMEHLSEAELRRIAAGGR